ncbi:ABC transporter substrate-binding protein [Gracilibacillus suaedae]|uniref:ABC transporter substrate-binding protein n=1 Tax=Gracilibacillus suaedae TaxID=2820273 RepID=UPI001E4B761B|nr:sugar ABC transporter substrate-binding protein [Gracilibacillus suaedae]
MKIKNFYNKGILNILLMVLAVITLSGCMGSGGDSDSSSETGTNNDNGSNSEGDSDEITLEFQQWWGVELPDGVLREIVDGFTEETGINVELLSNPYADTKTQIAAGAAASTMADVVGLDGAWVYDFAKQGSIANLSTLMDDSGYDQNQLSDQIQVDGNTFMIPVANFAYPMYVNMDILEEAGIEDIPETRSEFTEVANTIYSETGKAGWAIPLSTESPSGIQNNFMSWLWASGGSMLDNGQPNLTDNSDLIDTVEFMKGLFDDGVVAPGAYAMKEADMVEEFTNGRVAFMIDSLAHLNTIQEGAPDMNFDFVPVPVQEGFSGESGMDVANWGIGVAENSEHKEEAWQLVEYMMSPEVNAELAVYANAFPGNANADPDYSDADDLFLKAYELYQDSNPVNEFTGLPTSEELMRTFAEQLQLYIEGDTGEASEMLSETQSIWEEAFE